MPVKPATVPAGYREADANGRDPAYWLQSQGGEPFGTLPMFSVVGRVDGRTETMATLCHTHHAITIVNALRAHARTGATTS